MHNVVEIWIHSLQKIGIFKPKIFLFRTQVEVVLEKGEQNPIYRKTDVEGALDGPPLQSRPPLEGSPGRPPRQPRPPFKAPRPLSTRVLASKLAYFLPNVDFLPISTNL